MALLATLANWCSNNRETLLSFGFATVRHVSETHAEGLGCAVGHHNRVSGVLVYIRITRCTAAARRRHHPFLPRRAADAARQRGEAEDGDEVVSAKSFNVWFRAVFTYTLGTPPEQAPRGPTTTRVALPATGSGRGTFCCRRTSHVPTALEGLPLNDAEVGGGGLATKRLYPLVRHLGVSPEVEEREPSEAAHRQQPLVRHQLAVADIERR
jgi:hypothetical protein